MESKIKNKGRVKKMNIVPIVTNSIAPHNKNKIKAIRISRVSSAEQVKGYSLDAQKDLISTYAKDNTIEIVEGFDFYESAGEIKERKHFNEALEYVKNHGVKAICVEKTDRVYRNHHDMAKVKQLIMSNRISLHLIKEGVVLAPETHSSVFLLHYMNTAVATNQHEKLREETRKGFSQKAKSGRFPYRSPIGYKYNREYKKMEADPNIKHYIKKVFELYASGEYSLKQLADKMYDLGLRPKPINRKKKSKSKISRYWKGRLWTMLSNPVYYGDFLYDGKLIKGNHEPIIDFDTFQKCQEVFKARREGEGLPKNNVENDDMFILRDLLRNEENRHFTAHYKRHNGRKMWIRYGTSLRRSYPNKRFSLKEDRIFEAIDKLTGSLSFFNYSAQRIQSKTEEIIKSALFELGKEKHELKYEYLKIKAKKDHCIDLCVDGVISREELRERRVPLDKQLNELEEKRKKLNLMGRVRTEKRVKLLLDVLWEIPRNYEKSLSKGEKVQILRKLVAQIIVTSQKQIKIELRPDYAALLSEEDHKLLFKGIAV